MKPPALVFDFGNVVAFFDYTRACDRLVADLGLSTTGTALIERARASGLGPLVARYERGELGDEEFLGHLVTLLDLPASVEQARAAWTGVFWINQPVADLIARLDERGHTLVLGSNTNAIHATGFLRTFAHVLDRFDGLVLSYRIGCSKPSPGFFHECARVADRAPGECLFIDDMPENVAGARAAGLLGLVYTDPDRLVADLREHGVEG